MADIQFHQVSAAKLFEAWPAIEEGLLKIKERCPNATWSLGQMYQAIRTERAQLWCAYVDGEYEGFCVFGETFDTFTNERRLLAWAGYSTSENPEVVRAADKQAEEIARSLGIKKIVHQSPRLGWQRRLSEKQGWKIYEVTYIRELE